MRRNFITVFSLLVCIFFGLTEIAAKTGTVCPMAASLLSSDVVTQTFDFSADGEKLQVVDRGDCHVSGGVLHTKDAYALFGDKSLKDYSFTFKARNPKDAEQVQIWAGFRAANRFDRYIVGIKGGVQDDIYLARLGYMGTDEFMGVRPLGFHPEPGKWYTLRVEVFGNRIRVFVGDNKNPHIDVTDKNNANVTAGQVSLGGGWIATEYDDLTITPITNADDLMKLPVKEHYKRLSKTKKEEKRQAERAAYSPIRVAGLKTGRNDIALDGNWLFMPSYQMDDKEQAISETADDQSWHVMNVPDFWTPIRIWLHGETMPTPNGRASKGVSDTYYQQQTELCENYTFEYDKTNAAWYRQWVELPAAIEGKNITLTFDAVSKAAEIYINGQPAGTHIGMFGEIVIDGSGLFRPGRNLIAVKVTRSLDKKKGAEVETIDQFYSSARGDEVRDDVKQKESNSGKMDLKTLFQKLPHGFFCDSPAGIWQPVRLTITDRLKVEDAYINTALDGAKFELTVKNHAAKAAKFSIFTEIVDKKTGEVLYRSESLKGIKLNGGEQQTYKYDVSGLSPKPWSPQHPNLYDFKFRVSTGDELCVTSGFRTFEVKDGLFYLNGNKYWLRAGNQAPSAICPNDSVLAHKFFRMMSEGNIDVTRTHTSPFNELWMKAADEEGIGVSFEGTYPWLMLGKTDIPDETLLNIWADEFVSLVKKYRNHPSLLFWTVNNEMKFYDNDGDKDRARRKMTIVSDLVKRVREADPSRPVSFDSNYISKGRAKKFGADFMAGIDDGDIDDMHAYYNWYNRTIFMFFKGEFEQNFKSPGRPLISQEMASGYSNNETGHPVRFYSLVHQTPMSLLGYKGYDFANPKYFLNTLAFTTGELAEALRRSNPNASGIMHFSLHTWFKQVYDAASITPWPVYHALKRALQPVLVSAELWGRHVYGGDRLTTRFYIVNDREDGTAIKPSVIGWQIKTSGGKTLASGKESVREVKHYEHFSMEPAITLPEVEEEQNVKLVITLTEDGKVISSNEYDLLLSSRKALEGKVTRRVALLDADGLTAPALDGVKAIYNKVEDVTTLLKQKADVYVISGLQTLTDAEVAAIRKAQAKGVRLVLLNGAGAAMKLYPEYIVSTFEPTEGDIAYMEQEDDRLFDGIDVMSLRYFNDNRREIPRVCNTVMKTKRDDRVTELGGHMKIHSYIDGGTPEKRLERIDQLRGYTILRIADGKSSALVSTMCTEKAVTDPVAARLLVNILND